MQICLLSFYYFDVRNVHLVQVRIINRKINFLQIQNLLHQLNAQYYRLMNIKDLSATYFLTSVQSSGGIVRQVVNQLPMISYYLQVSTVCSNFHVDIN